jgi:hypothetical protein
MRGGLTGQLRIGAIPTSLPVRLAPDDAALAQPPGVTVAVTRSTRGRSSAAWPSSSSSSASRTSTRSRSPASARCRSTEEHYMLLTDAAGPFATRTR